MDCLTILQHHTKLSYRKENATKQLTDIKDAFSQNIDKDRYKHISVFCGGSLGRGDVGSKSDLDLFILFNKRSAQEKRVESLELLSAILKINKELGYPEFSNDAQYLKAYSFPDMMEVLGSPSDDNENLFTARMLLLLESKPIFNNELYASYVERTLEVYFRDSVGKSSFKPLFLLNDLLRYWRTLCLNYEIIRNNPERPWRKKNINLKFSRMLTVFGTVLPLIAEPASTDECAAKLIPYSPLERLALGLDMLNDAELSARFPDFLEKYEVVLAIKEGMGEKLELDDATLNRKTSQMAKEFSGFLFAALTHNKINPEFVKYLVL